MPASPSTTATAAELRQDLGIVAYERWLGSAGAGHIGLAVMPAFRTDKASAKFPVVDKGEGLRPADDARGPSGHYNEVDFGFRLDSYDTEDRGLEGFLDDALVDLYAHLIDAETAVTQSTTDRVLIAHERRVAALVESGGEDVTVSVPWTNRAASKPYDDVSAGKLAFRAASGILPNAIAMSLGVFEDLAGSASVQAALIYSGYPADAGFEVRRKALAAYLGIDEILVAGGMSNTAQKGKSTVLADIWSADYAHLLRVSEGGQNALEPAYGRTIMWTAGAAEMLTTETYRIEARRGNMIRIRNFYNLKRQYAAAKRTLKVTAA